MPTVIPLEIATVGSQVLWAVEETAGVKPTLLSAYTQLLGVSSAPAIEMTPETIDVSDISDYITQYVEGRQDPGGDAQFTLIHSDAAIDSWEEMKTAADAGLLENKRLWFVYLFPKGNKAYYFSGRPLTLGNGGIEQNAADTIPAHVIPNGENGWDVKPA